MDYNKIEFQRVPFLKTKRFNLIEINETHLDDVFELYSDESVTRYFDILPLKNIQEAQNEIEFYKKRFQDQIGIRWGIVWKDKTEIIGTLGFNKIINNHKGRIGYDLKPKYWGQGVMTEVLEAIIDYGFYTFSLARIEAEVMQGNIGSEKLLTKLQFKKEGVLRDWMYWNNACYDITMFSLLKSEFKKK